MKKITKSLFFILFFVFYLSAVIYAQAPEMFNYQAVLRDGSGTIIANQNKTIIIDLLKDSATGINIFTETHNVTTTAQGLINLSIGSVNPLSGINWGNTEYYIKVTVDGTVMSTSQLLSVPYALHAKTADVATSIVSSHYVGEFFGGGIIFWVSPDGQHGLIMSINDINSASQWSNITNDAVGNANDMYDGLANSNAIVAQQGHTSSAAKLCLDYTYNGFDDWYLPALWELSQIYHNCYTLNYILANDGDANTVPLVTDQTWSSAPYPSYWSSTEGDSQNAWGHYFASGNNPYYYKYGTYRVRAVRAF